MNVSLTPELQKFIEEKVRQGSYQTASEVVREALRLLAERDEERCARLEQLRTQMAAGRRHFREGRVAPLQPARIKAEGRRRLAARRLRKRA